MKVNHQQQARRKSSIYPTSGAYAVKFKRAELDEYCTLLLVLVERVLPLIDFGESHSHGGAATGENPLVGGGSSSFSLPSLRHKAGKVKKQRGLSISGALLERGGQQQQDKEAASGGFPHPSLKYAMLVLVDLLYDHQITTMLPFRSRPSCEAITRQLLVEAFEHPPHIFSKTVLLDFLKQGRVRHHQYVQQSNFAAWGFQAPSLRIQVGKVSSICNSATDVFLIEDSKDSRNLRIFKKIVVEEEVVVVGTSHEGTANGETHAMLNATINSSRRGGNSPPMLPKPAGAELGDHLPDIVGGGDLRRDDAETHDRKGSIVSEILQQSPSAAEVPPVPPFPAPTRIRMPGSKRGADKTSTIKNA